MPDPTLPISSGRNKLYDDTKARSGQFFGDVLQRDFSRDPIDTSKYNFGTTLVDEGEKVMLLGDKTKGKGTIVVDRKNYQNFDPQITKRLRKQLFDSNFEDRNAAINFLKEKGVIQGDISKMTRQNLEDVLIRFEDSIPELNDLYMYDRMLDSYKG